MDIVGKNIMHIDSERKSKLSIDATEIPKGGFNIVFSRKNFIISRKIVLH